MRSVPLPARQAKVTGLSHKIHANDNEQYGAYLSLMSAFQIPLPPHSEDIICTCPLNQIQLWRRGLDSVVAEILNCEGLSGRDGMGWGPESAREDSKSWRPENGKFWQARTGTVVWDLVD